MGAKEVRNDVKKEQPAPAASASPTAAVTPHLEPALPLKIEAPIPPSPNMVSSPRPATSEVKNEVPDAKEVRVDVKKEQPAPAASASPTAAVAPRLKWPIPSKVEAPTPPSLSTLFSLSPATSEVEKEVTGAIEVKNDVEEEQLAPAASASPTAAITPHLEPALPLKIEAPAPPWPSTLFSPSPATSEVENEVRGAIEVKNDVEQEELARAQARVWAGAAAAISNFTRSSLVHARRLAAHGNELFSLAAAKAIRERAALEWKPPRVRIVLTGLPLRIKILVTRQHSEWKMRNPDATRDTRLRNAMIMAAACAVVGLIAVSLAPHFAARFLPSHALRSGSTLGAKTVGPSAHASTSTVAQPSKSTVAAGPESPKNRKSHSTPAASRSQGAKPSPQTAEAQPKHRSTKDDDYVAPNTYKYYGNRGSR
jgi:hypothetical protein